MKVYALPPMEPRYPKDAEPLKAAQAMLTDLLETSGNRLGLQYAIDRLSSNGHGDIASEAIDKAIETGLVKKLTTSVPTYTYLCPGSRYTEEIRAIWGPEPRVPFREWLRRHRAEKDRVIAEIDEQVRRRDAGEPFGEAAKRCITLAEPAPGASRAKRNIRLEYSKRRHDVVKIQESGRWWRSEPKAKVVFNIKFIKSHTDDVVVQMPQEAALRSPEIIVA